MSKKTIAAALAAALVALAAATGIITWDEAQDALRWLGLISGVAP